MTEEEIKLRKDTVYRVCYIKIEGNEIHKDYKALTDSIRIDIKKIFFCK